MDHPVAASQQWTERAGAVFPAGGTGNFDPSIVIESGQGARVRDVDGNEYVDLLIGSGPMILGHGHPEVLEASREAMAKGLTFFTSNPAGIALAERIVDDMACAEQVRFFASGGEADMYAMRAARAHTGRAKIMKFEGGYHGMCAEAQMSLAPQQLANFPQAVPDSAGIQEGVREAMLIAPFNDLDFARSLVAEHGHEIAGMIVEPLQRVIPPAPGFLQGLRDLCDEAGIVLIFDEIVTGYRLAYGGAQEAYGVVPDLCTLGKIVGGGFALAALAGREAVMRHFDKALAGEAGTFMMHSGTLSGNPVAASAGLVTLALLREAGTYARLEANGRALMQAFAAPLDEAGIAYRIVGEPCLFDVIFTDRDVRDYRDWMTGDAAIYARYMAALRNKGVLKPPGKVYTSLALTEADIEQVAEAARHAAQAIA